MNARRIALKLFVSTAMLLALLASSVWPLSTDVLAHSGYTGIVPIFSPPHSVPSIDGVCNVNEYSNSLVLAIPYTPRINYPSASVRLLKMSGNLYICASGLGINTNPPPDPPTPYLAVYFDVNNSRLTGRFPESDDLRFVVPLNGSSYAQRGNGSVFVNAPDVTAWETAQMTYFTDWSAEYRISSSLLGTGTLGESIGFHVRYHDVRATSDDYFWPPNSQFNNPTTWADLFWGRGPLPVLVDVLRITQGMDFDISGLSNYNLIAGKDTLLRAQLYTQTGQQQMTTAVVRFQRQSREVSPGVYERVVGAPVETLSCSFNPLPWLNAFPYGVLSGVPTVDCWIPARMLRLPGIYAFEMSITFPGIIDSYHIALGTKEFKDTADLRIYIQRLVNPHILDTRSWGSDLDSNIIPSLHYMNRMNPLETGVNRLAVNGLASETEGSGIRYFLNPTTTTCPVTTSRTACDDLSREQADRSIDTLNGVLRGNDLNDGRLRDRLDFGIVLVASTGVDQGGRSCRGTSDVAATGYSAGMHGPSASMISHELNHCMGQVSDTSPHSDGGHHSSNEQISYFAGDYMVNTHDRRDYFDFFSLMHGEVGDPFETIQEGFEWNDLRDVLKEMTRHLRPVTTAWKDSTTPPENGPLFQFGGLLYQTGVVTVTHASRVDNLSLDVMNSDPGGAYSLNFLDSSNQVLSEFKFNPSFEGNEGEVTQEAGLYLVTTLPEDSARYEIRKGATLLHGKDFSSNAPSISNLDLSAVTGGYDLTWESEDEDGEPLEFSIFYTADDDLPLLLIAQGLIASIYHFDTEFAGGTQSARLMVQASDGYNLSAMEISPQFSIPDKDPLALIEYPTTEMEITQGRPVILVGSGYDYTSGAIDDEHLKWESDRDGNLGSGSRLEISLSSVGTHNLTLDVEAPSGRHATEQVNVTVRADTDGDGLSDDYENMQTCQFALIFDSLDDPDGDNLPNLAELRLMTNPCESDTDEDGVADGDEVWMNVDPNDSESTPPPEQVFLRPNTVQLDCFGGKTEETIDVQTFDEEVSWSAVSDSGWLSVTGGGTGDGQIALLGICEGLPYGLYTGRVSVISGSQYRYVPVELILPDKLFLPLVWSSSK